MKYFFVFLLSLYQVFISNPLKSIFGIARMCRFSPSCSEFAKQAIMSQGIFKGSLLSVKRIAKCQPFYKES